MGKEDVLNQLSLTSHESIFDDYSIYIFTDYLW